MSEVKVNKISPRTACGTTTLGDSGDTFNIPCGSKINVASGGNITVASGATITNNGTQTGFGRTGTVDWVTTPKVTGDSPVTGATGSGYFLNTTAGVITINLPAGAAGSIVSMADYAETWHTYNVTVTPNGADKIGALNSSAVLSTQGQSVTFVYVDSTQGWVNTMDSTSNVRGVPPYICASVSGACNAITTCGDCKIATFKGPGTFTVCRAATCAADNIVSYAVQAGGGGAGDYFGAGGGAGGFRELKNPNTPYTASPLDGYPTPGNRITVSATGYPIAIGGGGTAGARPGHNVGGTGGVSTFSCITSAGGGGGSGSPDNGAPNGANGGSGGGGGGSGPNPGCGGTGNTPPTTPAQGTDGGDGGFPGPVAGGGGGATTAGESFPNAGGGIGAGTGINPSPTIGTDGPSAPLRYIGGGGKGAGPVSSPYAGAGGGGAGYDHVPSAGLDNAGGGGGNEGTTGGSGIVIIRYKFQ